MYDLYILVCKTFFFSRKFVVFPDEMSNKLELSEQKST